MAKMTRKRLFVVGCPRSGTTLLQSIFAAHKGVTSFLESHFFPSLTPRRRVYQWMGLASNRAHVTLGKFLDQAGYPTLFPEKSKFGWTQRSAVSSFVQCLDAIAEEAGSEVWVEKTPRHLHYIELIENHVEEPVFVHIVRRGQDVVPSLYQVTHQHAEDWGGPRTLETCIERWNHDIQISWEHRSKANHHVVHYGELVENREAVTEELFRIIGLPSGLASMRDPHSEEIISQITTDDEVWKSKNKSSDVSSASGKYQDILTAYQRQDVEANLIPNPFGPA